MEVRSLNDAAITNSSEGFVRTWNGGASGRHFIAVTINRFGRGAAAKRFIRWEVRAASGVVGLFPDIGGAVGLQVRKAAGMPDGGDGFGSVVIFSSGNLGS
jgi:hypothetical protein